mmetsp:Transcript_23204/g.74677  ORF Transcript_23204/g.74677 Transcript_23204/m.74677 type:complete len:491 (+) Transcript_23204:1828-3300(+)
MGNARRLTHHDKVERNRMIAQQSRRRRSVRLWGGVAAAAIAAVAFVYQLLVGVSRHGIVDLDATSPEQLKAVFAEGYPWVVLCTDSLPTADYPSEFDHAARVLDGKVHFGVLNCSAPLPSGKDVYTRFGLARARPTYLFAANTAKPLSIPDSAQKGNLPFVEWIERKARPKVAAVRSQSDLRTSCTDQRLCALVLLKGAMRQVRKDSLHGIASKHRRVRFAVANHTRLATSLDKFLPETTEDGVSVVIFRSERSEGGDGARSLLARAFRGDATAAFDGGHDAPRSSGHRVLTMDGEERWLSLDQFLVAAASEPHLLDLRALRKPPRLTARGKGPKAGKSKPSNPSSARSRSGKGRSAPAPPQASAAEAGAGAASRSERAARRQRAREKHQQQQKKQQQHEEQGRGQKQEQEQEQEEGRGTRDADEVEELRRREALERAERASPHIAWAVDDDAMEGDVGDDMDAVWEGDEGDEEMDHDVDGEADEEVIEL